jgi:4-alpha-glucanotransferase
MIVNFHINYGTIAGEYIGIRLKRNSQEETINFQSYDQMNWHGVVQVADNERVSYKYYLQTAKGLVEEHGEFRPLFLPRGQAQVFCQDFWRPQYEVERSFFSAAFKDVIFRRKPLVENPAKGKAKAGNKILFQLYAAAIPQHLKFCVLGKGEALGDWKSPVLLSEANYPTLQAAIEWHEPVADIEFKFAAYDPEKQQVVEWETGENRRLQFTFPSEKGTTLVHTAESFRYPPPTWRGAGMAIPVFSLRSENGCGIGEFNDLKLLTDWAVKTGMKLVQTLPVNDTIATKTWTDSYPYAAISVFALHPLYVNLSSIAKLKDKKAEARLKTACEQLNQSETVDFEGVLKTKTEFFKLLYEQEKADFFKNKDAQIFTENNADWLKPYAAFCHLRDLNGTTNFNSWKKYSTFSQQVVEDLCRPEYKAFDEVALYFFIQYHAHRQLLGATEYARQHGVVLKGDLPIGIYRESCDAWVAPHLYNMDGQAGAPPDAYAEAGQNWGFPTYNWEAMANNGFEWWRQRMTKLAEYFDALRIDHILGFFRIWQIPTDQVEGTLGLFNPRLPYTRQELAVFGLTGSLERYTQPYIREHFLGEMFGQDAAFVRKEFLKESAPQVYRLREFVDNQLKIRNLFADGGKFFKYKQLEKGLMRLLSNVLLIGEPVAGGGTGYNPRITVKTTRSFKELSEQEQRIFNRLYDDYFYQRHDDFWRQQALWKLPALLSATNMLICGEDLGMIPKSVPQVMRDLCIMSLEIQRMPKGNVEFDDPAKYPYPSVCSPSCHDMSTIRGWWEGDPARSQRFFETMLHQRGKAPLECPPAIVEAVNRQHLASPSMWAIFPVQDLVGMDAQLRRPDAAAEQINDPSITPHYWRFRFHLPVEQLLKEDDLNWKIRGMVMETGR